MLHGVSSERGHLGLPVVNPIGWPSKVVVTTRLTREDPIPHGSRASRSCTTFCWMASQVTLCPISLKCVSTTP